MNQLNMDVKYVLQSCVFLVNCYLQQKLLQVWIVMEWSYQVLKVTKVKIFNVCDTDDADAKDDIF